MGGVHGVPLLPVENANTPSAHVRSRMRKMSIDVMSSNDPWRARMSITRMCGQLDGPEWREGPEH